MLKRIDRTNCICFSYEDLGNCLLFSINSSTPERVSINLRSSWDYFSCNCCLSALLFKLVLY